MPVGPKIIIDIDKCDGCGAYVACLEACPMANYEVVMTEKGKKISARVDYECLGCKKCVIECPREAITIITEEEG